MEDWAAERARHFARRMRLVEHLRKQHRELHHLANGIVSMLGAERLANDSTAVRMELSAFARKLRVHLVLEDRFIYGRLLHHSDRAIVAKASEHQKNLRSLRDHLTRYASHWISIGAGLEDSPGEFIEETKELVGLVSRRFDLEDRDLYPLVERICSPSGTWPLDLRIETDEKLQREA